MITGISNSLVLRGIEALRVSFSEGERNEEICIDLHSMCNVVWFVIIVIEALVKLGKQREREREIKRDRDREKRGEKRLFCFG